MDSKPVKVHFMDARCESTASGLVVKTQQLFERANLSDCFSRGDKVAVKLHMGEWGNTGYIRPILIRVIVDKIKELGGEPFVTDTTTLPYIRISGRQTAKDYLETAASNGFTEESVGCPIIIADGSVGLDDVHIEFPEGVILNETFIGQAIAEADAMIAVSHFKGHGWGVYGGAIKNIGVGCVSKRGKVLLHMCLHPTVGIKAWKFDGTKCRGEECNEWTICQNICPTEALLIHKNQISWHLDKCIGCIGCIQLAFKCGIRTIPKEWYEYTVIGLADSAAAVLNYVGKKNVGYITFGLDVTPICDCAPYSDMPITPNLGIFASKDIVAVDLAALDLTMQLRGAPDSQSEEKGAMEPGTEKFTLVSSRDQISQWMQINVCDELGLGTKNYELEVEPVSSEWWRYCFPRYRNFKKPPGYFFRKYYQEESLIPKKGFHWKTRPRISIESLSSR